MNTSDKHIILQELYGTNALSTRAAARELMDRIKSSEAQSILLDFRNIRFASRSFMDELNAHLSEMSLDATKTNMNTSVRKMDELVQQPRTSEETNEPDDHPESEVLSF